MTNGDEDGIHKPDDCWFVRWCNRRLINLVDVIIKNHFTIHSKSSSRNYSKWAPVLWGLQEDQLHAFKQPTGWSMPVLSHKSLASTYSWWWPTTSQRKRKQWGLHSTPAPSLQESAALPGRYAYIHMHLYGTGPLLLQGFAECAQLLQVRTPGVHARRHIRGRSAPSGCKAAKAWSSRDCEVSSRSTKTSPMPSIKSPLKSGACPVSLRKCSMRSTSAGRPSTVLMEHSGTHKATRLLRSASLATGWSHRSQRWSSRCRLRVRGSPSTPQPPPRTAREERRSKSLPGVPRSQGRCPVTAGPQDLRIHKYPFRANIYV